MARRTRYHPDICERKHVIRQAAEKARPRPTYEIRFDPYSIAGITVAMMLCLS